MLAYRSRTCLEELLLLSSGVEEILLLLLEVGLLLQEIGNILLGLITSAVVLEQPVVEQYVVRGCICLLLRANLLLDLVDLGIELGGRVGGYYKTKEIRSCGLLLLFACRAGTGTGSTYSCDDPPREQ